MGCPFFCGGGEKDFLTTKDTKNTKNTKNTKVIAMTVMIKHERDGGF